jgi:hypothetical protein
MRIGLSEMLSIRDAAKAIGINHATVSRAVHNGDLRAYRVDPYSEHPNPRVRVRLDELRAWQERQVYRPTQTPQQRSKAHRIAARALSNDRG